MNLLFVLWAVEEGLEDDVRLQVVQDLVVAEVAVLRQVQNGSLLLELIVLVVVDLDQPLSDEVHFLDIALVANHTFTRCRDAAVHLNDEFVGEASLTLFKEVVEGPLKLLEHSSVLDQVRLHLWSDLLVELELLDDQVEVVQEGLLDVFSDVVVQGWLDVEWFV